MILLGFEIINVRGDKSLGFYNGMKSFSCKCNSWIIISYRLSIFIDNIGYSVSFKSVRTTDVRINSSLTRRSNN